MLMECAMKARKDGKSKKIEFSYRNFFYKLMGINPIC